MSKRLATVSVRPYPSVSSANLLQFTGELWTFIQPRPQHADSPYDFERLVISGVARTALGRYGQQSVIQGDGVVRMSPALNRCHFRPN